MKILLLSNKVAFPAEDGSTIAIKSMVEGLMANQAEVWLYSLNTLKHYKKEQVIKEALPEGLKFKAIKVDTNIKALSALANLFSKKAYHVSRFKQKQMELALQALLSEEKFDIIQLEGLSMAVYLPLLRAHSQAKISLRAHNLEYQIWERHLAHESSLLKRAYLKLQVNRLKKFEMWASAQVDYRVFITEEDQMRYEALSQNSENNIAIACGLNPKDYKVQDATGADVVHLASMDWLPNQQGLNWFLSEVWPELKALRPSTSCHLAGRHMPQNFIDKAELGLQISGEVANAQHFLRSGKVVIVPLLAGSGMRIKIVENMALGKAMVATSIGAEGVALSNDVEIRLADQPRQFALAIADLLDHPDKAKSMGQKARKSFEKLYSNASLGKKLLDFYNYK